MRAIAADVALGQYRRLLDRMMAEERALAGEPPTAAAAKA
jgi:hypothetical protein